MRLLSIILVIFFAQGVFSVNRSQFKTCEQSSFCRRCRNVEFDTTSQYNIIANSFVMSSPSTIRLEIENVEDNQFFIFNLIAFNDNTFRILIDEKQPLKERYRVNGIVEEKEHAFINILEQTETGIRGTINGIGDKSFHIQYIPFKIDFMHMTTNVLTINGKGFMKFEHLREKPDVTPDLISNDVQIENLLIDDDGAWEENFNGFPDSKPNGPEAIAIDFQFQQAQMLFGIPEHADSFRLTDTNGTDEPYRLYNLDVYEYELNNKMALYGSVPVIYGHGEDTTIGIYWQNAAETWIDTYNTIGTNNNRPIAHFMSESGIIDFFVLMGPQPNDCFKQYTDLTGVAPLPQMFTLGYHQSRWNYYTEEDVQYVSDTFDEYGIQMDTMWLDIEYTDDKKYFTWNLVNFTNPASMIKHLEDQQRHLVLIIDPHIKIDLDYFVHITCTENEYYVKNKNGIDFVGNCWPGASSYPDFFNPDTVDYFSSLYSYENFNHTTENVMIWNDMNEPSVFDGPEVTMLKDNIHYGDWEHRDLHNLFSLMYSRTTFIGLGKRSNWRQRPFILTRAHFAGSQRYTAIWTGDNTADWEHLAMSIKMCLSESVAGLSFCGADIGGFFMDPNDELIGRWYQTGAFQPFYRGHAHMDTKRREPWLFADETTAIIREAIEKRYSYLPFWYTLFYEHQLNGLPIMRPLLAHFPNDVTVYDIDNQYLLSDILLVSPVVESNVQEIYVYFPKTENIDLWYDIDDYTKYSGTSGYQTIKVDAHKIPVYQRGGTILAKKETKRQTATQMKYDDYTLIVCIDSDSIARGTLYIDDEQSYDYQLNIYNYLEFNFNGNILSVNHLHSNYGTNVKLSRVIIAGLDSVPTRAIYNIIDGVSNQIAQITPSENSILITDLNIELMQKWTIEINSGCKHIIQFTLIIFTLLVIYLF